MNVPKSKWSIEDENTLIELVEKYESKGKSKQEAFEMVANIINRTKAACAARYRLLSKKQLNNELNIVPQIKSPLNLDTVIQFLINYEDKLQISEQNTLLKEKIKKIKKENEELNKRIFILKTQVQKKQNVLINLTE